MTQQEPPSETLHIRFERDGEGRITQVNFPTAVTETQILKMLTLMVDQLDVSIRGFDRISRRYNKILILLSASMIFVAIVQLIVTLIRW